MKKILLALISLFVVLGFAGSALAVNTGIYLGKVTGTNGGNDNNAADVESFLNALSSPENWISYKSTYFSTGVDLQLVGKSDENTNFTATGNTSGTWNTNPSTTIYFYTIKAAGGGNSGGGFEVYWIENGATTGDWELYDKTHNMSHISGWTFTNPPPSTPVPIPASVLLLGSGLVGIIGFSRRKKKM